MNTAQLPLEIAIATTESIQSACSRIAPLWPLQSFVAVNPFLGLAHKPFGETAQIFERITDGSILAPAEHYLEKLNKGEIIEADVQAAARQKGISVPAGIAVSWLTAELKLPTKADRVHSIASWLDKTRETTWTNFITDEISKWCSSFFDHGQSAWEMPFRNLSLLDAWMRAATVDANPSVAGLKDFHTLLKQAASHDKAPEALILWALKQLPVQHDHIEDYLHSLLLSVNGWSAYAAYQDRCGANPKLLPQLLAIRLIYDLALFPIAKSWKCTSTATYERGSTATLEIAQLAAEHAYRQNLSRSLISSSKPSSATRPAMQAVFCIDVRSEVYRRALESQDSAIKTTGFAGFFGMPIGVGETARCPVLLSPAYKVEEGLLPTTTRNLFSSLGKAWNLLRRSTVGCFASVEVAGLFSGTSMLRSSWSGSHNHSPSVKPIHWQIPLEDRIKLAAGALKGMSFDAAKLAPTVLLCGHGSQTENNPYAAGLDCGACGGHAGDINARFAVALFNDPEVRAALAIPLDTVFIAGLHNTTTDEVTLFDAPANSNKIQNWLNAASALARRERNLKFKGNIDTEVKRRSGDWSEIRPEWGLAGNAAFIAAPRERTASLNLRGRVFLHDYNDALDTNGSILSLILNAPVVVASWINLQYYGSTVNNQLFGSGNKVLHNVVGTFGIWEGNAGDLRTGLPLQSLHDGEKWMHEPLRLQVFIATPRERMDQVMRESKDVRNLVENEWIHLMSLEGDRIFQCRKVGDWHEITSA
jgi:uncharacterized protein YbcC (UPF0753/DUF2309 family)